MPKIEPSRVTPIRLENDHREYWEQYAKRNHYKNIGACLRDLLEKIAANKAVMIELPEPAMIELEFRAKVRGRSIQNYLSSILTNFAEEAIEEREKMERQPKAVKKPKKN